MASLIHNFIIPPCPLGMDHTYFLVSIIITAPTHPSIHFTHECDPKYHNTFFGHLSMDPSAPLDTIIDILHSPTISSFPHTPQSITKAKIGTLPQNSCYDDECCATHARLRH